MPYSPLGRGFLTGRLRTIDGLPADDVRRNHPRFQGDNFESNLKLAGQVNELAREKGCTPGQLALAWVMAQGEDMVPIPGTRRREHLVENVRAVDVGLTADELRKIDEAFPKGAAAGLR